MRQFSVALATAFVALAPVHAADVIKGAEMYKLHCSGCHGSNGRPVMSVAPDLSQPVALLKPDLALLSAIQRGKGAMPSYQGILRDREILDIVAHMRTWR